MLQEDAESSVFLPYRSFYGFIKRICLFLHRQASENAQLFSFVAAEPSFCVSNAVTYSGIRKGVDYG